MRFGFLYSTVVNIPETDVYTDTMGNYRNRRLMRSWCLPLLDAVFPPAVSDTSVSKRSARYDSHVTPIIQLPSEFCACTTSVWRVVKQNVVGTLLLLDHTFIAVVLNCCYYKLIFFAKACITVE